MKFIYTPELLEYMEQKKQNVIVVEVVEARNTDIEFTDFHIRLVNQRLADIFRTEKKYRSIPTEHGEVLLPRYRLEYDETIRFGLKKTLWFKTLAYEGIRF